MNVTAGRIAKIGLISIFSLTLIFHLLILTGIIPYSMVWGRRINSQSQMIVFETVSIVVNAFFLLVVLLKSGFFKVRLPEKIANGILWVMVIVFLLNTVGNLLSANSLEKIIFTPITLLLAVFSLILVLNKKPVK
ncbi:hypothetical protein [Runella sp.]|jgi:hypothetical protein|uniref:hypothetical protein n=1 Tax=Runella sp. TaxID=1960881 RepID=UPI002633015C|nr:hypothetical protein [Runella sp.]